MLCIIIALCLFYGSSAGEATKEMQEWYKREHYYTSDRRFSRFEISYRGKILIADNDKDITDITPGGFLKISKSSFGNRRSIEINSDASGKLTRIYYDGHKSESFETYGREWLEDILPEVIYKTGIGGKERALRIYKDKGIKGVLNEVDNISYDKDNQWYTRIGLGFNLISSVRTNITINVRNLYLKVLVDYIDLNKEELKMVLRELESVGSNSTKGTMLRIILDKYSLDPDVMESFFRTTGTLSYNTERGNVLRKFQSKYKISVENCEGYFNVIKGMGINSEKGNVLKPLLLDQILDDNVMIELLRAVKDMSSSSEKAAILRLAIPKVSENKRVKDVLISAINSVGGSYYLLNEELITLMSRNSNQSSTFSKSGLLTMMDHVMKYEANTRKSILLRQLHASLTDEPEIIEKYFEVVNSMDNQMERYNLMLDLIYSKKLSGEWLSEIFSSTREVATEDYVQAASAILRATLKYVKEDESLMKDYFAVLEKIDQNSCKEEIIRIFCEYGSISNKLTVYLFKMVEDIQVDIETATSLLYIRKAMPKDSNLEYIYSSIAKKMESDYEYERAMIIQ